MSISRDLVEKLNYSQKVDRALCLLAAAYQEHKEGFAVASSLGKDSIVVWDLARQISDDIPGFIVTTRYKPLETVEFMHRYVERYPNFKIFRNDEEIPDELYRTDPDQCCQVLKVRPIKRALRELNVKAWATGLRCTEGNTRTDMDELEEWDGNLVKVNPILIWEEREVWQYIAINKLDVNPLYDEGYRSLGCAPCSSITAGGTERDGRWQGTAKEGGECGIHTQSLSGGDVAEVKALDPADKGCD